MRRGRLETLARRHRRADEVNGYNGWLNGDLIHGILKIISDLSRQYIVPALAFDHWHRSNQPDLMFYIPDNHPSLIHHGAFGKPRRVLIFTEWPMNKWNLEGFLSVRG